MKRKLLLFFLLALLLTISVCAAQTQTCSIDELHMRIDVPADHIVYMRNMDPDDPALEDLGMSAEQLTQRFTAGDIYLDVLCSADAGYEYLMTMVPNPMESMTLFDESNMDLILGLLKDEFTAGGVEVSAIDLYSNGQIPFVRAEGSTTLNGVDLQLLIYYTVHNYQAITLSAQYMGDALPEEVKTTAREMVDSIRFDETYVPDVTFPSFPYTDSETGVSFTVPEDWVDAKESNQKYYTEEQEKVIKANFACAKAPDLGILYSCYDVMEEMPGLFKLVGDRSMIDQEVVELEDIIETIPFDVRKSSTETIGGREFYVLEVAGTSELNGVKMDFVETDVIRVQNGFEYAFSFSGTADDPRYADFLSLVESAEFPDTETATALADKQKESDAPAADGQDAPAGKRKFGFLSLAGIATGLAAVGAALGLIIARRKKKRARQQIFAVPATPDDPAKRVCAACGADLAPDEQICPYCDTKAD